jgi:hypothetical protein
MQEEQYIIVILTGMLIACLLGSTIFSSNTAIALDPTKIKKGIVGFFKFKANKDNPLKIPIKELVHLPNE